MATNNENKCPDHPKRIKLYCLDCVNVIADEAISDTAKQIFRELGEILKRGSKVYDTVEHRVYYELTIKDEKDYQALKRKWVHEGKEVD